LVRLAFGESGEIDDEAQRGDVRAVVALGWAVAPPAASGIATAVVRAAAIAAYFRHDSAAVDEEDRDAAGEDESSSLDFDRLAAGASR
jgi:hypothetical protein